MPMTANPHGGDREPGADHGPTTELGRQPGDERRHHDQPDRGRQGGETGLERAEAEGCGVLEVEAQAGT